MKTIRITKGDVNKLVVDQGEPGRTSVRVYDGTGGSDNDLLVQFSLDVETKGLLIRALLKN
jgi:hypothetical protein